MARVETTNRVDAKTQRFSRRGLGREVKRAIERQIDQDSSVQTRDTNFVIAVSQSRSGG